MWSDLSKKRQAFRTAFVRHNYSKQSPQQFALQQEAANKGPMLIASFAGKKRLTVWFKYV